MKKIFIAIFLAIIMLMLPVTAVAQTTNLKTISKISIFNEEPPKIFITPEERIELDNYIEQNFDGDLKNDAINIVNGIISPNYEVNTVALAEAISLYFYNPIPEEKLTSDITREELDLLLEEYWGIKDGVFTTNLFGGLISKIVDLIKDRLGWVYELFSQGASLFVDGIHVLLDLFDRSIIVVVAIVAVVNQILAAPQLLSELLNFLFTLEFQEFLNTTISFIQEFGSDLTDMIESIKSFINNQGLVNYLGEIQTFIDWLGSEPWKAPIHVTGEVLQNFVALSGATIICRGTTSTTNSNGEFDFWVDSTPADDSIPPGQWYGMHNCAITVSKDGKELKRSPDLLSYVFAGGEIQWSFFVWKSRSIESKQGYNPLISSIIQKIQLFISDLYSSLPHGLFKTHIAPVKC